MDYSDKIRTAPSAAALNRLLTAAGSEAWLQRSGKLWQPMIGGYVDGFASDYASARSKIAQAFDEAVRLGTITPLTTAARRGRPAKAGDAATTRAIRMTDADWAALKRIGLDRMRELVRKEDARQSRAQAAGEAQAPRSDLG